MAGDDRRVHRRVEDRDAALAAGLRRVHRDVGVAEQLVGVLVRVAPDRDADRSADHEVLAGDGEGHLERLDDPARDGVRPAEPVLVGQQQRELVAAESRGEVVAPDAALDPLRHRGQQPVARGVAERVVDDLEVVQVEEQHRQHAARRPGLPAGARPARRTSPGSRARSAGRDRPGSGAAPSGARAPPATARAGRSRARPRPGWRASRAGAGRRRRTTCPRSAGWRPSSSRSSRTRPSAA